MDDGDRISGLPLEDKALQEHLRRLQDQAAHLAHRHLALGSWLVERKALEQEKEWRLRHPETDL
jgi:hypothetical protein